MKPGTTKRPAKNQFYRLWENAKPHTKHTFVYINYEGQNKRVYYIYQSMVALNAIIMRMTGLSSFLWNKEQKAIHGTKNAFEVLHDVAYVHVHRVALTLVAYVCLYECLPTVPDPYVS